jgi:cytidylate kinase
MTPKNIILLGPAGAGKSSQMAQIHLYTNCDCISLGNILRAAGFLKTPLGKRGSCPLTWCSRTVASRPRSALPIAP